jgi:ferrochelatase
LTRTAVVLFNLGGPDGPDSVRPFLFNLFKDPAIIGAPGIVRLPLAQFISRRREKEAKANYAIMGGGSPLLPETQAQAAALDRALAARLDGEARCFIAMRYWHPLTHETARAVKAYAPDDVVLLPLYPQFSTTTTGSSLKAWREAYHGPGRVRLVCCYPDLAGLVRGHADHIRETFERAGRPENVKLLFSAHGLPERVVQAGDPYQAQVEATCAAIAAELGEGWDWSVCYQSRVGPLQWIGPSTVEAIEAAGSAGRGVLVVPVAFVSEHVETLVELDHEYRELAAEKGCPLFLRAPALGITEAFIDGLAGVVATALGRTAPAESACGGRWCPAAWSKCPAKAA